LPVTDGSDIQARAQGFADSLAAKWKAKVGDAPPLAHARPPSLAQLREQAHAAAAYHQGALLRNGTIIWRYAHILLALAVYAVVWITKTPVGALVGAGCGFIIWTWL
jgi:hypothetical protein